MTVDDLLTEVLYEHEGWPKVTDHPSDIGGLSKGGISLRFYNDWLAKTGRAPITPDELRALPESSARAFLEDAFAKPFRFIGDEPIFELLVDWAVNAGPDDPTRALQQRLTAWGCPCGAIDGVMGSKTRLAWSQLLAARGNLRLFHYELVLARFEFHFDRALDASFRTFLKTERTQAVFLRGWLRRTLAHLKPSSPEV